MMYKVTLIPGDGIGPDLTRATVKVLEASGVGFDWEEVIGGEIALQKTGDVLPEETLESIKRNKIALKGPMTTPVGEGFRSVNVALRQILNLYVNLRPFKTIKGIPNTFFDNIDLVVVRENTEDLYAGIEHMIGDYAGESIKIITRPASERIVRYAFEYAIQNKRRKVTAIHKANIIKCSDGLFLKVAREVAEDYPGVEFEDRIVDNMAMQLVQKPDLYDVIVAPNLYGDILSDLCAGLIGGLGIAPGANIGKDIATFEPVHGSAPKYADLNVANPTAMILSGVMMLRHLNEEEAAVRVDKALEAVIAEGKTVTQDLGGTAKTSEFAEAIVAAME
ncbi:MAG TPA: isocitrate/isopropylmalate dehydrogenase family protein [Firmicutes bacterium]|nr:isocitrate/isopropylmalate dehydrogenase family protein [Bacillota bacterium]